MSASCVRRQGMLIFRASRRPGCGTFREQDVSNGARPIAAAARYGHQRHSSIPASDKCVFSRKSPSNPYTCIGQRPTGAADGPCILCIMIFKLSRKPTATLLLALTALVAGCSGSGVRTAEVDVTAFATWGAAGLPLAGSTYRFERLPSQLAANGQSQQVEAVVRDVLSRKGLQLAPGATPPRYSVQVSTSVQQVAGLGGYPYGPTIGISGGSGGISGAGIGFGFPIGGSSGAEFRTELQVLVRNLQTSSVVYEARAYSQDALPGDFRMLAAMADSGLKDFPVPPVGVRRYRVQLAP